MALSRLASLARGLYSSGSIQNRLLPSRQFLQPPHGGDRGYLLAQGSSPWLSRRGKRGVLLRLVERLQPLGASIQETQIRLPADGNNAAEYAAVLEGHECEVEGCDGGPELA